MQIVDFFPLFSSSLLFAALCRPLPPFAFAYLAIEP